jgi:glycine/D-amino acid oxidase-like deaminating enzyme
MHQLAMVGAGVIGLSCAWRAAAAGWRVTVIDPAPARGASWVAGGMLAPVTEAWPGEEELLDLGLESLHRWPGFAADLAAAAGREPGLREAGTVVAATGAGDRAELASLAAFLGQLGREVDQLTGRELRRLEPALGPDVRGGLSVPGDLAVDNRAFLAALQAACERAGVVVVPRAVRSICVDGGRVTGVCLAPADACATRTNGAAADRGDRADPGRADPGRADPGRADPGRADPDRADPDRADPDRADPDRADPDRADPDRADGDRADGAVAGRAAIGLAAAGLSADAATGHGIAANPADIAADAILLCAGACSGLLHPALAGLVRPVKGEIVRLAYRGTALPPPTRTVRALVEGRPVYAVPRDGGGLVVGATQYEAGFDTDVTVAGVRDLLRDVERVLPAVAEYTLVETGPGCGPAARTTGR